MYHLLGVCFVRQLKIRIQQTRCVRVRTMIKMHRIKASEWRPYVALQFLAHLGMFDGQIVRHLGEPDAVCLLAVFSL